MNRKIPTSLFVNHLRHRQAEEICFFVLFVVSLFAVGCAVWNGSVYVRSNGDIGEDNRYQAIAITSHRLAHTTLVS